MSLVCVCRVCVEVPLARNIPVAMDCIAFDAQLRGVDRRGMHVQGISHWAPANIGPYSQAIMVSQISVDFLSSIGIICSYCYYC